MKPHSLALNLRDAWRRGFGLLETPSRQVAAAAAVIGLAIVVSFVHDQTQSYDRAIARVERDTRNVAVLLAEHASRSLGAVEQTLHAVDRLRGDVARGIYRSRDSIYIHLKALEGSAQLLTEAGWFDRYGIQVASSLRVDPPAVSLAEEEIFQAHRAAALSRLHVSATARERAGDRAGIDVSLRLENLDGSFAGVALGRLDVEQFETVYRALDLAMWRHCCGPTGPFLSALRAAPRPWVRFPREREARRRGRRATRSAHIASISGAPRAAVSAATRTPVVRLKDWWST